MTIRLVRIDERLIHGQVVVAWGERLGLDYYVVVDEELAASEWEQELWASAVPEPARVYFVSPEAGEDRLASLFEREGSGAVLTRGTGPMRRLAEADWLAGRTVNVGGLHAARGRRRITDYLYLSPSELDDLRVIARCGSEVEARDLPDSRALSLERLEDAAGGG